MTSVPTRLPSNKVMSRQGMSFRPNNSHYLFDDIKDKRVRKVAVFICLQQSNFTYFWLQKSKQQLGFFEPPLFILLVLSNNNVAFIYLR